MTSEHTLKHFKENWFPDLILRTPYEEWKAAGGKDLGCRARERVLHLLDTHVPNPLEDKLKKELKLMVQSMDK